MVHGTSEAASMKICQTGFISVCETDSGYYGQGEKEKKKTIKKMPFRFFASKVEKKTNSLNNRDVFQ